MDRSSFLQGAKTRVGSYPIEAMGGEEVHLSSLSIKDRKKIELMSADGQILKEMAKDKHFSSWIIATCLRNESGERLFNPDDKKDLDEINLIDSEVSDQIVKAIFEHSGLAKDAAKEAEKN